MDLLRERLWYRIIDGPSVTERDLSKDMQFHDEVLRCIREKDLKSIRPIMTRRFNEIQQNIE